MLNSDAVSDIQTHGIDLKNREIFLHGYIANTDDDPGVDYKMAATFYKNIRTLDNISHDPIIIHSYDFLVLP